MIRVLLILLLASALAAAAATEPRRLPNIVITLADDVGLGDVGFTQRGTNLAKTPVLDALALGNSTWVLNQMHSEAACSPTRLAILSARAPLRDCCVGSPVPGQPLYTAQTRTIVHLATSHGYRTLFLGKYFPRTTVTSTPKNELPSQLGFENWTAIEGGSTWDFSCVCRQPSSAWHLRACFLGHESAADVAKFTHLCSAKSSPDDSDDFPPRRVMEADHLSRRFHDWLANDVPTVQPFFAQISFRSVHIPFVASPELRHQCYTNRICYPVGGRPPVIIANSNTTTTTTGTIPKRRRKTSIELDYAGCVHSIDQAVGKIRESIRTLRPLDFDNTLFIFLSDNGPEDTVPSSKSAASHTGAGSNGGLVGTKGTLFEGLLRVPALLEWPSVLSRQQTSNSLMSVLDLPATIVHAITGSNGGGGDVDVDGVSFLPFLLNQQAQFERAKPLAVCAFSNSGDVARNMSCKQVAVIDGLARWKMIADRANSHETGGGSNAALLLSNVQLFDLFTAGETRPVNTSSAAAARVALCSLQQHATSWLSSVLGSFNTRCPGYLQ